MMKPKPGGSQPDTLLFLGAAALTLIGIVAVYSASRYIAADSSIGDGFYYLKKQCLWAGLGFIAMLLAARFDLTKLKALAWPVFGVTVALLALVKFGAGVSSLGAERTIALGPLHFQPGEAAKLALALIFAYNMSKRPQENGSFCRGFLPQIALLAVVCGLIMLQPDLGTAVVLVGAAFLLMLAGGVKIRYLAAMVVIGVALVGLAIYLEPFRMARFTAFLDPWADAQGYGFQTVQSLIAIGSGGITGVGLGNGSSKWYYLPEVHTDFIFALIGEEMGLIGCSFLLALFALVLWRGFRIALYCEDPFLHLLAVGITAVLGVQMLLNLFVATGMMPVTGVALPFISYGGSSLLFTLLETGLLLNISTRIPKGEQQ